MPTVFPNGKHDDQVNSTAQFLEWFKKPFPDQGLFECCRQRAQQLEERRKPQPVKTVWAEAAWNGKPSRRKRAELQHPLRRPYPSQATQRKGATTELDLAGEPRVRIRLPPAVSWANSARPETARRSKTENAQCHGMRHGPAGKC